MKEENNLNEDLQVCVTRLDNNEKVIDGKFVTVINVSLTSDGDMATSFFGLYNEGILKTMEKEVKKYFKELKKSLKKNPLLEEANVDVKKEEDIPEEQKLQSEDSPKEETVDLESKKKVYDKLTKDKKTKKTSK